MGSKLSNGGSSSPPNTSPTGVRESPSSLRASTVSGGGSGPSRPRPQHEFLLDNEPEIIRRNWTTLSSCDTQGMGVRIFLRIFELAPATKNAFESFRDKATDELMSSVIFRSHSMRFMRAIEVTIGNLDALDVIIVPNLKELGKKHTQFHGFHPEYLTAFEQAMDEVWGQELQGEYDAESREAWKKIFHLITTNVLEGYTEAGTPKVVRVAPTAVRADDHPTANSVGGQPSVVAPASGDIVKQQSYSVEVNGVVHPIDNSLTSHREQQPLSKPATNTTATATTITKTTTAATATVP